MVCCWCYYCCVVVVFYYIVDERKRGGALGGYRFYRGLDVYFFLFVEDCVWVWIIFNVKCV